MNNRERFLKVANFERPDYYPLFAFIYSPGFSAGCCMEPIREKLIREGMPAWVGAKATEDEAFWDKDGWFGDGEAVKSWNRYWGTASPVNGPSWIGTGAKWFKNTKRIEGDFEIIEYETGAVTRQVKDNDSTYSMPQFLVNSVRDRKSWEFYRDRITDTGIESEDYIKGVLAKANKRTEPLLYDVCGSYGWLRDMWGEERVCTILYDEPDLVHEQMEFRKEIFLKYSAPLMERMRPEMLEIGEDVCYNHGMLLSPKQFLEFFGDYYRTIVKVAKDSKVPVVAVDTDGNCLEFAGIATKLGVNCLHPMEVKAGNNLAEFRKKFPKLIMSGGIEKEAINEGNESMIEKEVLGKVPGLLEKGGYFPNGDHGI